jgi:hypothetical protein
MTNLPHIFLAYPSWSCGQVGIVYTQLLPFRFKEFTIDDSLITNFSTSDSENGDFSVLTLSGSRFWNKFTNGSVERIDERLSALEIRTTLWHVEIKISSDRHLRRCDVMYDQHLQSDENHPHRAAQSRKCTHPVRFYRFVNVDGYLVTVIWFHLHVDLVVSRPVYITIHESKASFTTTWQEIGKVNSVMRMMPIRKSNDSLRVNVSGRFVLKYFIASMVQNTVSFLYLDRKYVYSRLLVQRTTLDSMKIRWCHVLRGSVKVDVIRRCTERLSWSVIANLSM